MGLTSIRAVRYAFASESASVATAAREERRISRSRHGGEYRDYMRRTGRFVPRKE